MYLDEKRKRRLVIGAVLLVALPCLGALAGRFAAPALARTDYSVQVARRLGMEESRLLKDRTLQSAAYRATGQPFSLVLDRAREVERRFRWGAALFGLWCGLVVAMKVLTVFFPRRRKEYEAHPAFCVACGRCYLSCPVEHKQLKRMNAGEVSQ